MRNFQRDAYGIELNKLLRDAFGRDLTQWFRWKVWNNHFESYSIARPNSELIAHTGVFRLQLHLGGEHFPVVVLAAIATARAERGRGHIRKLLGAVLERCADTPVLLTAPSAAATFLQKFDFRPVQEQQPVAEIVSGNPAVCGRKLTPEEARPLLEQNRCDSSAFRAEEALPLELLRLCCGWADQLLLLRDGLAAACHRRGETLHLGGLFGPNRPDGGAGHSPAAFRRPPGGVRVRARDPRRTDPLGGAISGPPGVSPRELPLPVPFHFPESYTYIY